MIELAQRCARLRCGALTLVAPTLLSAQAISAKPGASVDTVARPASRPAATAARKSTPRTEYKNLRFEETWSRVPGSHRWDDQIKAIPLAPHLALSFGGQVRAREEYAHSFNLTSATDAYSQSRTLLNADLQLGSQAAWRGRVYGEFRDAQSYGRELPGGARPNDADRSDVQNLFVEAGYGRSFVRVGRQEVVVGRERLIGVPDWSNTRRGFQGTRGVIVRGRFALDILDARPMVVRQTASNLSDSTTRFVAVTLSSAPGAAPLLPWLPATWQSYWYTQRITAAAPVRRVTAGGRAQWSRRSAVKTAQGYSFEYEGALQRGSIGARAIEGWFWTLEAATQWRGVRGTPALAVGLEEASGDRDPADGVVQNFNALYAAAHGHGGYADVFGRANARQLQFISTWEPVRQVALRGSWHRYDRLSLADGIYNKQNTVLRAASSSTERHAGDEFDLTGTLALTRHLKVVAGHAWVQPGAFMRTTPGGASAERWGFLGSTYTF